MMDAAVKALERQDWIGILILAILIIVVLWRTAIPLKKMGEDCIVVIKNCSTVMALHSDTLKDLIKRIDEEGERNRQFQRDIMDEMFKELRERRRE